MATIKIRGRLEPVTVSDDVAKKIKDRKFGNGVPQALPNELVDMGEWSGEYGRIVEIELSTKRVEVDPQDVEREKERERVRKWLTLSPETKGSEMSWFKLCYSGRTGDYVTDPPADVMIEAQRVQTDWYRANPTKTRVPSNVYGVLLPPKKVGHTGLAEKMRVNHRPDEQIAYPS